jgi:hypothetical protein
MPIFHCTRGEETEGKEVTGVTGRSLDLIGRVRSVAALCAVRALGFATGASGPSRNQSIRSGTQRTRAWRRADWTRGASGNMRSDVFGHDRSSLEPLWTVTGRWNCRVRSLRGARPVIVFDRWRAVTIGGLGGRG